MQNRSYVNMTFIVITKTALTRTLAFIIAQKSTTSLTELI